MTSPEEKPVETNLLTDEELANVSTGNSRWYRWLETSLSRAWAQKANRKETNLEFEDWLRIWRTEDDLAARDAWIAADRPDGVTCCFEAGKI